MEFISKQKANSFTFPVPIHSDPQTKRERQWDVILVSRVSKCAVRDHHWYHLVRAELTSL